MMAMSLYGGSGTGGSPYHPFGPASGSHKPLTNHLERGSRKLPRPKRSRRKKQREVSLYPSISAVEEAVPEAIISFHDNGTFEISLSSKDEMNDAESAGASGNNNEEIKEEEVVSSSEESMMTDEEDNPLDVHSKPFHRCHHNKKVKSALSMGRRSSISSQSSMSSQSSETKLNQEFRKLSVKRKPVASAPWPIDDEDVDPLGGILSTAPRRKVSRHASRDSQHSRGSLGSLSCDSSSTGSAPHHRRHRRTATFDSINSEGSAAPSLAELKLQEPLYNQQQKPKKHSRKSTGSINKNSTLSGTPTKRKTGAPFRRMKSWHDDEKSAEKRAQELEIEPGFFLPLRGTDETMAAVKTGFVEEIFCQACDVELLCIADASMCVCPECKCVSPVDGIASLSASAKSKYTKGSVGLGLRASNRV
ncbi:expressed unknown protein [Seminavis robusta]|uniref:Uncharacterized protein n=1 Tax=Seminavis robusta TaxID=568900 RepID=A0A9N8HM87_9STRA|nr:expressed unknown protein [Seminavis robusta]|eukprot:Sro1095_g240610.1 n/a (419) ;mRNA; f:1537-2793